MFQDSICVCVCVSNFLIGVSRGVRAPVSQAPVQLLLL